MVYSDLEASGNPILMGVFMIRSFNSFLSCVSDSAVGGMLPHEKGGKLAFSAKPKSPRTAGNVQSEYGFVGVVTVILIVVSSFVTRR